MTPNEEFEEYLQQLIGEEKFTGVRNEMVQLPEGITELLHHDKLSVPLIKCQSVIILTATNVEELEQEWDCLIELLKSNRHFSLTGSFVSKRLMTSLSDVSMSLVEITEPLSEIRIGFPDLVIVKNILSLGSSMYHGTMFYILFFWYTKVAIGNQEVDLWSLPSKGRMKLHRNAFSATHFLQSRELDCYSVQARDLHIAAKGLWIWQVGCWSDKLMRGEYVSKCCISQFRSSMKMRKIGKYPP